MTPEEFKSYCEDHKHIGKLTYKVETAIKDLTLLATGSKNEVLKGQLYIIIEALKR